MVESVTVIASGAKQSSDRDGCRTWRRTPRLWTTDVSPSATETVAIPGSEQSCKCHDRWIASQGERVAFVRAPLAMTADVST